MAIMVRPKTRFEWFVEPKNSETSKIIANALHNEEDYLEQVVCEDWVRRNIYRCSSDFLRYLWNSKAELGIQIEVFNRELPGGKVRNCTFLFKRARTRQRRPK